IYLLSLYILYTLYHSHKKIMVINLIFGFVFFFQAEDGIRDFHVTGVQTCALPIWFSISAALPRRAARQSADRAAEGRPPASGRSDACCRSRRSDEPAQPAPVAGAPDASDRRRARFRCG